MYYKINIAERPKEFSSDKEYQLYLLKRIKTSEETNNLTEREYYLDLLFNQVYKFTVSQLKKYKNIEEHDYELSSLTSIAFMKAVNHFDLSKGCAFTTLYALCIRNEILMAYYTTSKNKTRVQRYLPSHLQLELDSPIPGTEDLIIADIITDLSIIIEEDIVTEELIEDIKTFVNNLHCIDTHKKIYLAYLDSLIKGEKKSQKAIARETNINIKYNVSRIIDGINKQLRVYLTYMYK